MKYENPLEKTPCINTLLAILCGAETTEELLELGVAKKRNTLYEILEALQAEKLIRKDHDYKPMPIKPNIEPLLLLFKMRQMHHGMTSLLVPEIASRIKKRFLRMRNKNNTAELIAIMNELNTSFSEQEKEGIEKQVVENTPNVINLAMQVVLKRLCKTGKKQRKKFVALVTLAPLKHFSEIFDGFFFLLVNEGDEIVKRLKRKEQRDELVGYLTVLRSNWNKKEAGWGIVERNKALAKFYKPLQAFGA